MLSKNGRLPQDASPTGPAHTFGKIMAKRFSEELVLDRMKVYEGRVRKEVDGRGGMR
jgi:hypothetical protein